MADKLLDREAYTCPICLDILQDPASIPCGHSFCKKCLQDHWDQQNNCRCPECRESFIFRPVPTKNIMLAGLVEKLKETEPSSDLFPGPQDVTCDVCTGRKLKAVRSCLQCLVSFCDSHLQPHRHVAMLQKHQLVAPSHTLQENICHEHDKLKEIFCRTDQKLICYLCCIDRHKGHDVVSSATERAHREVQVEAEKGLLKNRFDHKEADLQKLQQEDEDIRLSAQRAVRHSVDIFKEMALLLEEKRSEVEQQIRTEEQSQLGQVQELQDQLQQDLTELRRSISELEELSQTPDHNQFILRCPLVSKGSQRTGASASTGNNKRYFEDVTRALSALGDKLKIILSEFKVQHLQCEVFEAFVEEPDSCHNSKKEQDEDDALKAVPTHSDPVIAVKLGETETNLAQKKTAPYVQTIISDTAFAEAVPMSQCIFLHDKVKLAPKVSIFSITEDKTMPNVPMLSHAETKTAPGFSFSDTEAIPAPGFSFSDIKTKTAPSFSFWDTKRKTTPGFTFAGIKTIPAPGIPLSDTETITAPTLSFSDINTIPAPCFQGKSSDTKTTAAPSFSFSDTEITTAPGFTFAGIKTIPAPGVPLSDTKTITVSGVPLSDTKTITAPGVPLSDTKTIPAPGVASSDTKTIPAPGIPFSDTKTIPAPSFVFSDIKTIPAPTFQGKSSDTKTIPVRTFPIFSATALNETEPWFQTKFPGREPK